MEPKENNYRVTGRLTIDFQIIMQALDSDEAELFANDIHLDKWAEINREWQVLDVSKNYFLKQVNTQAPSLPTLKNHTGREQVVSDKKPHETIQIVDVICKTDVLNQAAKQNFCRLQIFCYKFQ